MRIPTASDLRRAKNSARARAGTFKFHLDRTRDQLKEARREVKRGQARAEALERERDALKLKNAEQASELRNLRGTRAKHATARFGSKSEKRKKKEGTGNKRGQQPGKSGHGRTPRPKLKEKHERHDPPASQRTCPCCGEPYVANGSHETSIMEVHVKAHIRRIERGRWRRGCQCSSAPAEIIAPPPLRLLANTPFGISVWECVLYERFACLRPLRRVSRWLEDQGLPMAPGTIAGGMKKMTPMFAPLAQAILDHQNRLTVRHGDETSWRIQSLKASGRSQKAWLWTAVSADSVFFLIDPSRSTRVAMVLFASTEGVVFLVCDRYVVYRKLERELDGKVILCLCWAHSRRDVIEAAAGQEGLEEWCDKWLDRIALIYTLNGQRLKHYDPARKRQSARFNALQKDLRAAVEALFRQAQEELDALPEGAREAKPLRSLIRHREGLCVFVDHPQVPMDNNFAERALRGAVTARKLSFGSDSEEGAAFTAIMYSVIGTLAMNNINVRRWLHEWLEACAQNGGKPPDDLDPWLPWSMPPERRRDLMEPG